MKIKLLLLSLLVSSFAHAEGNCGDQQKRIFSCSVEGTNFSIDLCTVNAATQILVTSDGETHEAIRKVNRPGLLVYGVKGSKLEVMVPSTAGKTQGFIQSGANQLIVTSCKYFNYNLD